jgi:Bax protein
MAGSNGLKSRLASLCSQVTPKHRKLNGAAVLLCAALGTVVTVFFVTAFLYRLPATSPPPPDFTSIDNIDERKQAFFGYFLPLIEQHNVEILSLRDELLRLEEQKDSLNGWQKRRVERLASEYELEAFSASEQHDWDVLLRRVDIVPPSLALAQAANESAWGSSRFAREANNYFGHWCFADGCGLVPEDRRQGAQHQVAAFESPMESVQRYLFNLNSHEAYTQLRISRAQLRSAGEPVTGLKLVEDLGRYSERGDAYIEELQSMIRFNNLTELDMD